MANAKRTNAARPASIGIVGYPMPKSCSNANNIVLSQEAIDRHWGVLPSEAKKFILGAANCMFPLWKLVNFWSLPPNIESTRGNLAGSICGAAWYLALVYLKQNRLNEARALTINGAFLHQCYKSSIGYIRMLCEKGGVIPEDKLRYFARGIQALQSPESMETFIQSYLPEEYTHMMSSFANMSSKKHVMGYIDQISDDWNGTSSASRNYHHRSLPTDSETQIKLILVDDMNDGERRSMDIGSSMTLKTLFKDYAEEREISLRSLRFSYEGRSLFLSSAGHKTPEELGMQDQDVINVHDTTQSCVTSSQTPNSIKTKSRKRSKNKKQKLKRKKQQQHTEPAKTLEEYKIEHSKQLTKIHGEVQDKFKKIRQRLNNLVIERSQPKIKPKRQRAPKGELSFPVPFPISSIEGIGKKAGKSHYKVQVGEVQNLYKTTKPSDMVPHYHSSNQSLTLDLHGYTRDEALVKLDESLKVWVDTAMHGSYPFVRPATIVCGCGNQVLSETVQEWIRANNKVSNAPKIRSLRRRVYLPRAA